MKIVADENIPLVEHYFSSHGQVALKPGRDITRNDLLTADILLVRSVTQVNEKLLHGTSVKFVGSPTTGMDHLDTNWLDKNGIQWAIATGCNARAVVEYVVCVIAALQFKGFLSQKKLTAGVIGVGNIGEQVAQTLKILGFEVIQYDPIRAEKEIDFLSTPLENFSDLDLVTLHTPLTFVGKYPTYHMLGKEFLSRQKPGCFLLNTARGSVINFAALKQYGKHLQLCFDVWENEPSIDLEVLKSSLIATPHIAGYSLQSKYRGIQMIYQAALQKNIIPDHHLPEIPFPRKKIHNEHSSKTWQDVVLKIYDPLETAQQMKTALMNHKDTFDNLRKNFVERYEFAYVDFKSPLPHFEKGGLGGIFDGSKNNP